MQSFKKPKDNEKYRWTNHIVRKMMHYRLTPARVLRIVRAPERIEAGVAPGTVAGMHASGSKLKPTEIWAMWRDEKKKKSASSTFGSPRKIIITAWRYPGVSKVREVAPIPSDVLAELEAENLLDEDLDDGIM